MELKSLERADDQQWPNVNLAAQRKRAFPISELPPELLGAVLELSLPPTDPMGSVLNHRGTSAYMAALYDLRLVSSLWRDTIDGSPSFWVLVSSGWSRKAVATAVARSGTCPLIIHISPGMISNERAYTASTKEFLRAVNPHRQRWAAAIVALPLEGLLKFFDTPIPRLDTLRLFLTDGSGRIETFDTVTPNSIFLELLSKLQHVHLNHLPLPWDAVLSAFKSLRTLILTTIRDHGIMSEQITQAISNNPFLESLTMMGVETGDRLVSVEGSPCGLDPVVPPKLKVFRVKGSVAFLHGILSRIRLPVGVVEVVVLVLVPGYSSADLAPLTALVPYLLPTIRSLLMWVKKSLIILKDEFEYSWIGYEGSKSFKLELQNFAFAVASGCIVSLTNKLDWTPGFPDLGFATESSFIRSSETLGALKSIRALKHIEISIGLDNSHLAEFLGALSGGNVDTKDDPVPFPLLKSLQLRNWRSGIEKVIKAVKQRYSSDRPEPSRPRCKLRLDFTSSKAAWFPRPDQPKAIIRIDKINRLRSIDGVKSVRFGCLKEQPGMMAVVWNEEESRVVWGELEGKASRSPAY
ncbi:hypothetical protein FRC00_003811 [Tulasnella sp. 408]|nr:hypothetical protein FRC00_003811 [Tulasnella sp. 408]